MKKFIKLPFQRVDESDYGCNSYINLDYVKKISFLRYEKYQSGDDEYIEISIEGNADDLRVDARHDSDFALDLIRWLEEYRCR